MRRCVMGNEMLKVKGNSNSSSVARDKLSERATARETMQMVLEKTKAATIEHRLKIIGTFGSALAAGGLWYLLVSSISGFSELNMFFNDGFYYKFGFPIFLMSLNIIVLVILNKVNTFTLGIDVFLHAFKVIFGSQLMLFLLIIVVKRDFAILDQQNVQQFAFHLANTFYMLLVVFNLLKACLFFERNKKIKLTNPRMAEGV